jgi:hypothetical protein
MDTSMVRRAGVRPFSTVDEGARAILNLATSPAVYSFDAAASTAPFPDETTRLKPKRIVSESRLMQNPRL